MDTKKELQERQAALEAEVKALAETIATMPDDKPKYERWVPENGERYYWLDSLGEVHPCIWGGGYIDLFGLSIGGVHKTKEAAETYRLRLESFVPALGQDLPDDETLRKGWAASTYGGATCECRLWASLRAAYLDGRWRPTKELVDAWIAKYGKVRGFTK